MLCHSCCSDEDNDVMHLEKEVIKTDTSIFVSRVTEVQTRQNRKQHDFAEDCISQFGSLLGYPEQEGPRKVGEETPNSQLSHEIN